MAGRRWIVPPLDRRRDGLARQHGTGAVSDEDDGGIAGTDLGRPLAVQAFDLVGDPVRDGIRVGAGEGTERQVGREDVGVRLGFSNDLRDPLQRGRRLAERVQQDDQPCRPGDAKEAALRTDDHPAPTDPPFRPSAADAASLRRNRSAGPARGAAAPVGQAAPPARALASQPIIAALRRLPQA